MQKILIIQTAFIGDVILATPVIEQSAKQFPEARIDFLLRKGNERLLDNHPYINRVLIWDKKMQKHQNLFRIIRQIRKERYDLVINLQRFFSTGLITAFSKGTTTVGFQKNPFSFSFSYKMPHIIGQGWHEVQRNLSLLQPWTNSHFGRPKLYPSPQDFQKVRNMVNDKKYVCIAPTSVWFTKQFPAEKWIALINLLPVDWIVFLLGGPPDQEACAVIQQACSHPNVINKSGELSFLESAALMRDAQMNYVNDSAPLHICSAMNAPVKAIFCSTVPDFGFTPLSEKSEVIETEKILQCRPCGLHGFKACPKGHFKCAEIDVKRLL